MSIDTRTDLARGREDSDLGHDFGEKVKTGENKQSEAIQSLCTSGRPLAIPERWLGRQLGRLLVNFLYLAAKSGIAALRK